MVILPLVSFVIWSAQRMLVAFESGWVAGAKWDNRSLIGGPSYSSLTSSSLTSPGWDWAYALPAVADRSVAQEKARNSRRPSVMMSPPMYWGPIASGRLGSRAL